MVGLQVVEGMWVGLSLSSLIRLQGEADLLWVQLQGADKKGHTPVGEDKGMGCAHTLLLSQFVHLYSGVTVSCTSLGLGTAAPTRKISQFVT